MILVGSNRDFMHIVTGSRSAGRLEYRLHLRYVKLSGWFCSIDLLRNCIKFVSGVPSLRIHITDAWKRKTMAPGLLTWEMRGNYLPWVFIGLLSCRLV